MSMMTVTLSLSLLHFGARRVMSLSIISKCQTIRQYIIIRVERIDADGRSFVRAFATHQNRPTIQTSARFMTFRERN